MKTTAEVIIVGGGVVGNAAAYYLAKRGVEVIVLEGSDSIGHGGSSRNGGGTFVVDAYPVSVHAWDVLLIFVTVLTVGFLSVWYPVRYLSKRLL